MNKKVRRSLKICDKKGINERREILELEKLKILLSVIASKQESKMIYERKIK